MHHAQGPGCYGHNGADDAAADAAAIAMLRPGAPVRVRWRREEEFGFEPVSTAMVTTVRAVLGGDGRPSDWTTEIWSGRHSNRPGSGGNLLAAEALPDPPGPPPVTESSAQPGAGTRNGEPLYNFAAKRISHHLIPETPVRTSSLRGLGATLNVFAIESFVDELAAEAGEDPVAYRLSILADQRARAVIERVAEMSGWSELAGPSPQWGRGQGEGVRRHAAARGRGIGFAQYKNLAAYAAVVAEVEVEETIRVIRVWCACDGGLVINPDGAINQLEGGIIQGISWALKEGVRLDTDGISLARLGALPGHQVQRGAGNLLRAGRSAVRQPAARHRRGDRRPDRRGDRQRRRAGPRHPPPRPADDPRAGYGGAAEGVSGGEVETMLRHFDHLTIVVRDLQGAKEFFAVLGFKEAMAVVIAGEQFASYMGVPGIEADHVTLVLENVSPRTEIQLLRYRHPDPLPDAHIRDLYKIGMNHICFAVDDIAEEVAKLRAHGFKTRNEIMDFHSRKLVFIDGPEGVTVELSEWH